MALIGLKRRRYEKALASPGVDAALLQILRTVSDSKDIALTINLATISQVLLSRSEADPPQDVTTWPEFASLARQWAERLAKRKGDEPEGEAIDALDSWADLLERAIAARADNPPNPSENSNGGNEA